MSVYIAMYHWPQSISCTCSLYKTLLHNVFIVFLWHWMSLMRQGVIKQHKPSQCSSSAHWIATDIYPFLPIEKVCRKITLVVCNYQTDCPWALSHLMMYSLQEELDVFHDTEWSYCNQMLNHHKVKIQTNKVYASCQSYVNDTWSGEMSFERSIVSYDFSVKRCEKTNMHVLQWIWSILINLPLATALAIMAAILNFSNFQELC